MSFSKIAWRSSFDRKAASKPGPAYSWTWPCSRFGCMSKKMTRPSLKPGAPDAPLVHQRARLRLGLLGRRVLAAVLGVDDDLGAGPRLDGVDRRLRVGDRRRPTGCRRSRRRPGRSRAPGRAGRAAARRRRRAAADAGEHEQPERRRRGRRRAVASSAVHGRHPEAARHVRARREPRAGRPSRGRPAARAAGRCRSTPARRRRRRRR